MLSHDKASFTDWFTNAEQDFVLPDWQFTYIHSALLPGLAERGVTGVQIEQMLVRNPREFFGRNDGPPPAADQTPPEAG
jgi:phosphotriesterase-related protein